MYAGVEVVAEPAVEPLDVDTVRRHCRVDSDYDDDLLTMYEISARVWAEQWLNRAFITQQLRYTLTTAPPPTGWTLAPANLWIFPLWWLGPLAKPVPLPRAPVQSVEQIRTGPTDNLTVLDPSNYRVDLNVQPAVIFFNTPTLAIAPGFTVQVDYTAGFGDDADAVPAPIKAGIAQLTAYLYEGRGDVNTEGPNAAWSLMAAYRLYQFSAG